MLAKPVQALNPVLKTSLLVALWLICSPAWAATASISGPTLVCPNSTHNFNYLLTNNNFCRVDWTFTTPTGTRKFYDVSRYQAVPFTFTGSGVVTIKAEGIQCCDIPGPWCGRKRAYLTVYVGTLPSLSSMSGPSQVCPNVNGQFSVSHLSQATSYTWQVPSGWKINGVTTTSRTINGSGGAAVTITPAAGQSTGNVRVRANANGCNTSPWRSKTVNVVTTVPRVPLLSGNAIFCENRSSTFSALNAPTALYFQWQVNGSPRGGGFSTFRFHGSWGHGTHTLRVRAVNACGASGWATRTVTVKPDWQCNTGGGPCHPCKVNHPVSGVLETDGLLGHTWDELKLALKSGGNYFSYVAQSETAIAELQWEGELPGTALVVLIAGDEVGDTLAVDMQPGEIQSLDLPAGTRQYFVVSLMPFQLQIHEAKLEAAQEGVSADWAEPVVKLAEIQSPQNPLQVIEITNEEGLPLTIGVDEKGRAHYPVHGLEAGKWHAEQAVLDPVESR